MPPNADFFTAGPIMGLDDNDWHLKTYTAGEDSSRLAAAARELGLAKQRKKRAQVRDIVSTEKAGCQTSLRDVVVMAPSSSAVDVCPRIIDEGFTTNENMKMPTIVASSDDDSASSTEASSTSAKQKLVVEHDDDAVVSTNKSGTPSPWAVFDAWGPGERIVDPVSQEQDRLLSVESVRIPTAENFTPSDGAAESEILSAYDHMLQHRSSVHFGYPYNLNYNHEEIHPFMKYSINNLGDPFVTSNYGVHSRMFETSVLDFFANLWNIPKDDYWGYVTTCGTEGNLHGMLLAREHFPNGILYSSKETHYSIFKAAGYYKMPCKSIPTLPSGEIDYDILSDEISQNLDRPVILNVNIGTTVKGAVDDLDRIVQILDTLGVKRDNFHIHCDGACFAMMMPFLDDATNTNTLSFETKPIDSVAVSGHKMLGCPMPCGISLTRKEHVARVEQRIDYLNSVDTTIMGSRNGQAALYIWYSLRKKGIVGIKRDVMHSMETAKYLRDQIEQRGLTCRLNDLSSTVVFERPLDDKLIKRWQLACEADIAHVVVMPNITPAKVDQFVQELYECKQTYGRIEQQRSDSPLGMLRSSEWK